MKDYDDEIITHIKNGNLEYLQFKKLNELGIKNAITLRHGGVSKGIYSSLNFRFNSHDDKENIIKNYEIIAKELKLKDNKIYKAKQNHTNNILVLTNENKDDYYLLKESKDVYDAYITNTKDIPLLITTADCCAIILYDPVKKVIANLHSGWRGTINRIVVKVVNKMVNDFGCNPKNIYAFFGPSIRKCCFSSEDEAFKKKFTDIWKNEDDYIEYEENSKRFHIDLIYLITSDLKKLGIKNIDIANICTACNSDDFYSYRAVTRKNIEDFGLMATIVVL